MPIQLSVIVPTYNEAESLPELCRRLFDALAQADLRGELVVVDDSSPDGTGDVAEALAQQYPLQVLHRPPKSGLSSAVIDGLQQARGELLAVLDADLSHPPEIIPRLAQAILEQGGDLAVASRYVPGGGVEDWPWHRRLVSWVANQLARPFVPMRDATSGCFALRREVVEGVVLDPIGFKIGLEIMAKGRYEHFAEVPYTFRDRRYGQSKFNRREVWNYLRQLGRLWRGRTIKPAAPGSS
ncbi:MAG: polyprenol monophosphomannose synthase [Chloroflexia bacterium]|nr:polyprenol monophosphomannose synthase [Chloroflexia bacterium]